MKRRAEKKANHERWLVSYADFITLLFAFFVVLFATGESDKHKKQEMAASIHAAFQQMGIFGPMPRSASAVKGPAFLDQGTNPPAPAQATNSARTSDAVRERIEDAMRAEISRGTVAIHESPEGLVISLREAGFFDSAATTIRPEALPLLDRLASALPEGELRIEGHTDNVPIHNQLMASNWELSSLRASGIGRLLLQHPNIHADKLSVAGYAQYHPQASNDTATGRAYNRRVDVVILNREH